MMIFIWTKAVVISDYLMLGRAAIAQDLGISIMDVRAAIELQEDKLVPHFRVSTEVSTNLGERRIRDSIKAQWARLAPSRDRAMLSIGDLRD